MENGMKTYSFGFFFFPLLGSWVGFSFCFVLVFCLDYFWKDSAVLIHLHRCLSHPSPVNFSLGSGVEHLILISVCVSNDLDRFRKANQPNQTKPYNMIWLNKFDSLEHEYIYLKLEKIVRISFLDVTLSRK